MTREFSFFCASARGIQTKKAKTNATLRIASRSRQPSFTSNEDSLIPFLIRILRFTCNKKAWHVTRLFSFTLIASPRNLFFCRETPRSLSLVLVDVENSEQLRHEQNVLHSLTQVRELHLTTLIPDSSKRPHQGSDSRTVYVGNICKIHQDVLVSAIEHFLDFLTQRSNFVPNDDLTFRAEDANVAGHLRLKGNCHVFVPLSLVTVNLL